MDFEPNYPRYNTVAPYGTRVPQITPRYRRVIPFGRKRRNARGQEKEEPHLKSGRGARWCRFGCFIRYAGAVGGPNTPNRHARRRAHGRLWGCRRRSRTSEVLRATTPPESRCSRRPPDGGGWDYALHARFWTPSRLLVRGRRLEGVQPRRLGRRVWIHRTAEAYPKRRWGCKRRRLYNEPRRVPAEQPSRSRWKCLYRKINFFTCAIRAIPQPAPKYRRVKRRMRRKTSGVMPEETKMEVCIRRFCGETSLARYSAHRTKSISPSCGSRSEFYNISLVIVGFFALWRPVFPDASAKYPRMRIT